jgi:hypothetical protein
MTADTPQLLRIEPEQQHGGAVAPASPGPLNSLAAVDEGQLEVRCGFDLTILYSHAVLCRLQPGSKQQLAALTVPCSSAAAQ